MARNPFAQRPRLADWPRSYSTHVSLSVLELGLLRDYAKMNGLALGAALRELALAGLLVDTVTDPGRGEWGDALDRARRHDLPHADA